MGETPSKISYGVLLETLQERLNKGWLPEDYTYFNELAVQLILAQRGVLRQAAKHLSETSWLNGWTEPFTDRIGVDYQF